MQFGPVAEANHQADSTLGCDPVKIENHVTPESCNKIKRSLILGLGGVGLLETHPPCINSTTRQDAWEYHEIIR